MNRSEIRTSTDRLPTDSLIGLPALMDVTAGSADISVAMIDGPVALSHPDLETGTIRLLTENGEESSRDPNGSACIHGTFVAGILHARRDTPAPGLCPNCTLMVCSIFTGGGDIAASPDKLARAIMACVEAGARVINLSADLSDAQMMELRALDLALDAAGQKGVIVVAAAGNKAVLGGSSITRHSSVIPVVACDGNGMVLPSSTLGASIGRLGLVAPGRDITSLSAAGGRSKFSGSSAAAPFVTGTVALLWSAFPRADATKIRRAVLGGQRARRAITPPLLDAWAAYLAMGTAGV